MKKCALIYTACVLLVLLLVFLYLFLQEEEPQYLTLDIPMPQYFATYAGQYAMSEEFSTFVLNDLGQRHRYFIYRMYVPVHLGEQGFETENDVENYYDEWLKRLGWQEARVDLCNYDMREFQSRESYRAYVYPTKYSRQPVACLVSWLEFGHGDSMIVLIKTINPSRDMRDSD